MMNRCNIVLFAISLLFSSSLIAGTIDVTKRGAKGCLLYTSDAADD